MPRVTELLSRPATAQHGPCHFGLWNIHQEFNGTESQRTLPVSCDRAINKSPFSGSCWGFLGKQNYVCGLWLFCVKILKKMEKNLHLEVSTQENCVSFSTKPKPRSETSQARASSCVFSKKFLDSKRRGKTLCEIDIKGLINPLTEVHCSSYPKIIAS